MKSILVIDDDQLFRDFMIETLSEAGHRVVAAKDGLEAMDCLKASRYDVIFVDLVMPNIDGKRICKYVRRSPQHANVVMVVLSSVVVEEEISKTELGFDFQVAKGPIKQMRGLILDLLASLDQKVPQKSKDDLIGGTQLKSSRFARELLAIKDHFEMLLAKLTDGIVEITAQGRIVHANPAALTLFAKSEEEILGLPLIELFPASTQEQIGNLWQAPLPVETANQTPYMIELNGYQIGLRVIPLEPQQPESPIVVMMTDLSASIKVQDRLQEDNRQLEESVTQQTAELAAANTQLQREIEERRKIEASLRESRRMLQSVMDNIPQYIFWKDTNSVYLGCNRNFAKLAGLDDPQDIVGRRDGDMHWQLENAEFISAYAQNVIDTSQPQLHIIEKARQLDGRLVALDTNTIPIHDSENEMVGILGAYEDITAKQQAEEEKNRLESQFQKAQKMEALGKLVAGIAHDFNNILTGIQGHSSLILSRIDSSHPYYAKLRTIERYIESGAGLTKQLLGFTRTARYRVKATDINAFVEKTAQMFGRTRKEIRIHLQPSHDLWVVELNPGQFEQVLLNLFVNAWHAMPDGGDLTIATTNEVLGKKDVAAYQVPPGNYVHISVNDTGHGMPADLQAKIFDPFFTTKKEDRGTGLGLASAYSIIKNHKGIITVSSQLGQGTTFSLYLPASDKELIEEQETLQTRLKGSETIMFVDDEEMIIEVGNNILKELGYRVILARGGREAVNLFKRHHHQIDLVILDLIMPSMGGGTAFQLLKQIDPSAKVLLASGYGLSGRASEIMKKGCDGFIDKPFNLIKLSHKIREILDQPSGNADAKP